MTPGSQKSSHDSNNFWIEKILKNVQNLCPLQNCWKLSFWQSIVSQISPIIDTMYSEERFLNLLSFVQK